MHMRVYSIVLYIARILSAEYFFWRGNNFERESGRVHWIVAKKAKRCEKQTNVNEVSIWLL